VPARYRAFDVAQLGLHVGLEQASDDGNQFHGGLSDMRAGC
jgi:hypothetical protein